MKNAQFLALFFITIEKEKYVLIEVSLFKFKLLKKNSKVFVCLHDLHIRRKKRY